MVTTQQWEAFRYVLQEGLTLQQAAKKMGVKSQIVKGALAQLKKNEPSLFPIETEQENIRKQFSSEERPTLENYVPEIHDSQIKIKF